MVKTDSDMGGLPVVKYLLEGIDEAEHRAGIQAFTVDPRIAEKGIVSSENQGISIKEV